MPRPSLLRHVRIATTLARYIAGRQRLQERMRATTPIRFLHRLTLIESDERVEPYEWMFSDTLADDVAPDVENVVETAAEPESRPEFDALLFNEKLVAAPRPLTKASDALAAHVPSPRQERVV